MAKIRSALPLSFALTPWVKRMRRTEGGGNIFIMTKKAETRSPGRSAKRLRAASEGVNLKNVIIFFYGVYSNLSDSVYNNSLEESFFIHRVPFP